MSGIDSRWTLVPFYCAYGGQGNGIPVGSVLCQAKQTVVVAGVTVQYPEDRRFTLDASGNVAGTLPATDDPDIDVPGFTWLITEDFAGGRPPYSISAPYITSAPGINLAIAAPVSPVDAVSPYVRKLDIDVLVPSVASLTAGVAAAEAYAVAASSAGDAVLQAEVNALVAGQVGGLIGFTTTAAMNADLHHPAGQVALAGDSGLTYIKLGAIDVGSWALTPDRIAVLEGMNLHAFGKKNGWVDSFFRTFNLSTRTWFGKNRWHWNNVGATFAANKAIVPNTAFDGNALQITANGTTVLSGPVIYMSDLGAVAGDTITIVALFKSASGATILMPGKFDAGTENVFVGGQISGLSDASATSITGTLTPQRMTLTAVVPATATRIVLYPYCSALAPADMVALWAFWGAPTAGPNWPALAADRIALDFYRTKDEADIAALLANTAGCSASTGPSVQWATDTYQTISYASKVTVVDVATFSSLARDLPFFLWAETFTPNGVTFNAVNIRIVSRTPGTLHPWRSANVVIRGSATPQNAGAPVLAVGSIIVNSELDTINDVTMLLNDPITGNPISLNDASFNGTIGGVAVYGLMADGTPAAFGEPRGTMANSAGNSYYQSSATNNPINGLWSPNAGNVREGVQFLMITSPVTQTAYAPSLALMAALGLGPVVPNVVMPPAIYGVQGRENRVYTDNLFLADAANWNSDYDTNVTSSDGKLQQQAEGLWWIPDGVHSGTLTLTVRDKTLGSVLVTKTAALVSCLASAHVGETMKVMVIGNSLADTGVITQTLLDIATGGDSMGYTLIGMRGTAPNKHEGRSGYTLIDYTTAGRTFYQFTVSGVVVNPVMSSTLFTNNGITFKCQSFTISGGSGTITCSVFSGSGTPLASGTLTKTSGIGDATVAFSASVAVPANPFWIGGVVDFPTYLSNNSLATPDWVFIEIGPNDIFSQTDDVAASALADSEFANMDILIASIKAAGAGVKVGLIIPPPPPSSQDAFGMSYFLGQTRARYKRNILIWARELIARYRDQTASRIYLAPTNAVIDTVNNMFNQASAPVNSRNSLVNVIRQGNGVHPGTFAYQQMGDCIHALIKCN